MGPPEGFPVKSSASKMSGLGFKDQGLQDGLQPSHFLYLVYVRRS